jgi:hypothetical protein
MATSNTTTRIDMKSCIKTSVIMKMATLWGAGCIAMALTAQAALQQTNGNFDAGVTPGNNQNDVIDWFDGNNHPDGFYQDTWQSTTNLPTGHSGGVAALSGEAGATNFLYQAIGTRNSGDATLSFSISVGAFIDSTGTQAGTLTVGLYEQTGSFTGADGTDVAGAEGITQVGTSVVLPITREGGAGAAASVENGAFDLSGTNPAHTLYLRYQWTPASGSYMSLDNASITVSRLANGSFDVGITPGTNQNDVVGWFDGNNHPKGFWEDTWQSTTSLPAGHSGGVAAFSGEGGTNFLYQAIGIRNSGDTTLNFSISVGAFTDVGGAGTKTGTLNVGLYQSNSFIGADGADVEGALGVTQVGSTVALGISRVGGAGAVASIETGSLDLSTANTSDTLYLRFQWTTSDGSYINVDNASISMSQGGVPYATWASVNGVAGGADEDSDNDGVDNGMEYFMGVTSSDPVFTANPGLDSSNAISWPVSATFSGNYEVETSPDLSTWTPVSPKPVPSGGFLNYTLPTGAPGGKSFVRLVVVPD